MSHQNERDKMLAETTTVMRVRDNQRSKIYKAEQAVDHGESFESIQQVNEYCDKILTNQWFNKQFPHRKFKKFRISDGRGRRTACGSLSGKMKFPKWSRTELTILHEVAHTVTNEKPAHGVQFAKNLLFLVYEFMGAKKHIELMESYKKHKVDFGVKRIKRNISPELKEILRERMAKARRAKVEKNRK